MSTVLVNASSISELVTASPTLPKRSSGNEVVSKALKSSKTDSVNTSDPEESSMVRIRSNFARDRVIFLDNGKLVLSFDREGFAYCPKHLVPVLEHEMKYKPGRYEIIPGPKPAVSVVDEGLEAALEEIKASKVDQTEEPASEEASEEAAVELVAESTETPDKVPTPAARKRGRPKKTNKK